MSAMVFETSRRLRTAIATLVEGLPPEWTDCGEVKRVFEALIDTEDAIAEAWPPRRITAEERGCVDAGVLGSPRVEPEPPVKEPPKHDHFVKWPLEKTKVIPYSEFFGSSEASFDGVVDAAPSKVDAALEEMKTQKADQRWEGRQWGYTPDGWKPKPR